MKNSQMGRDELLELEKLAMFGTSDDRLKLALFYHKRKDGALDSQAALHWLRVAADEDNIEAAYHLGAVYAMYSRDYAQAAIWYEKAAAGGHVQAQNSLAYMYKTGRGVRANKDKAREWYNKAAAQGDEVALDALRHL